MSDFNNVYNLSFVHVTKNMLSVNDSTYTYILIIENTWMT